MQRLFQRRQPTTAKVPPAELIHLHTRLYALGSETDADAIRDAMRHWDGYVREAALIRCTELGLVQLLPIVAERLNDWVPQIRHAARCAMLELLVAADAPLALGVLPDVQRLAGALREDHSAWIARFECALLEKIGARMLLDATRDAALKISRASFDLLARHRAVDARTLALAALHSRRDVALALRALDAFAPRAGEASPEARDIYLLAMRSSFGAVRARALPWLLSMSPGDVARQAVIDALLDMTDWMS